MMIRNICIILLGSLMLPGCMRQTGESTPVPVLQVNSSESALQVATAYLASQSTDTARHDMSKPERIQEITVQGQKAWRVSWKLKDFRGKGGQLIVIVEQTGICERGWGE